MLALLGRSLVFWCVLFEALADWRGWHGFAWVWPRRAERHTRAPWLLALPALALLRTGASRRRIAATLALTALPALAMQIVASSVRNRALDPLARLVPGTHAAHTIERLDIPMNEGALPALHVVPLGKTRAAVCVLHGSGCQKTSYAWRLVDTLIARGIAVLLVDLDGHGENPRVQRFPAILDDAAIGVAWLRERYERVGLLGISLGGCLAARAVADGVAVDALVVLEAPPTLRFSRADVCREALALTRPHLLDMLNDSSALHLYRAWPNPPIRAAISTWDLIGALDLLGSLGRIDAPLLLLYGAIDAIVKPAQAAEAQRAAPNATFKLVRGASHLTLLLTPETLHTLGAWLEATLAEKYELPVG